MANTPCILFREPEPVEPIVILSALKCHLTVTHLEARVDKGRIAVYVTCEGGETATLTINPARVEELILKLEKALDGQGRKSA